MKRIAPLLRIAFLVLFFLLLRQGLLLVWLGIYVLSLLFPLLWGKRLYCMLACPMNTLMSWIQKLKQRLGIKNRPVPAFLSGNKLVWASLSLTVAVFIISRRALGRDFPMMVVWMLVSTIMTVFYHPDTFHDKVCPFGLPQGCAARQSLLSEEERQKARNYQGFSKSVLGGMQENTPAPGDN